jgi:hypothetical protein
MLWGLWATAAVIDVHDDRLRDAKQCKCADIPEPIWPIDFPTFRDRPVAVQVLATWPH